MPRLTAALLWMFADRRTGRIVVAQMPNAALWVAAAAFAAARLAPAGGGVAMVLSAIETAALVFWAGDEILRGVNPWRRLLGACVLLGLAIRRLA